VLVGVWAWISVVPVAVCCCFVLWSRLYSAVVVSSEDNIARGLLGSFAYNRWAGRGDQIFGACAKRLPLLVVVWVVILRVLCGCVWSGVSAVLWWDAVGVVCRVCVVCLLGVFCCLCGGVGFWLSVFVVGVFGLCWVFWVLVWGWTVAFVV